MAANGIASSFGRRPPSTHCQRSSPLLESLCLECQINQSPLAHTYNKFGHTTMLMTTQASCGCRGCGQIIDAGERISWIEGTGPFHVHCSPFQKDKDHAAQEALNMKHRIAQQEIQNERLAIYTRRRAYVSRALDILSFVIGPMLIAENIAEYISHRRYYSTDSGFYLTIGVGFFAIGLLRIYWSKKSNDNSR